MSMAVRGGGAAAEAADWRASYLRSFLIFSISPGSLLAKVSFSDCNWLG